MNKCKCLVSFIGFPLSELCERFRSYADNSNRFTNFQCHYTFYCGKRLSLIIHVTGKKLSYSPADDVEDMGIKKQHCSFSNAMEK